jgi:hypothetical protein
VTVYIPSDWMSMDEPVAEWMRWGGPSGYVEFGTGEHEGQWRMLRPVGYEPPQNLDTWGRKAP